MSKSLFLFVIILGLVNLSICYRPQKNNSLKDDNTPACLVCQWLVAETEKYLELNKTEEEIISIISNNCNIFGPLADYCRFLAHDAVPDLINWIEKNYTPLESCQNVGLCSSEKIGLHRRPKFNNHNNRKNRARVH